MPTPGSETFGERLFRHRLAFIVGAYGVAALAAVALSRLDDPPALLSSLGTQAFLPTGVLCLLAFALRASGEARLGSAVYGQVASTRVVTSGPFRLLRHPLYAGTWLFFVAASAAWVPLVVLAPLALVFLAGLVAIAAHEERALEATHGAAWRRYAEAVPRFVGVPGSVEPDGISTSGPAWAMATVSNLGLLSLGLYRVLVGLGLGFRGLATLNLAALTIWVIVVVVRRVRAGAPAEGVSGRTRSP